MNKALLGLLADADSDSRVSYLYARYKLGSDVIPSNRQFRFDIAEMREHGIRICSSCGKGGYWLARSEEEYLAFRNEQVSRIMKIVKAINRMDANLVGQQSIDLER